MKLDKSKFSLDYLLLVFLSTFLITIFIAADFSSYPISDIKDIAYVVAQCLLIAFATFVLIGILGLNKYIFAIVFPPLVLLCSILGYYAFTMNTVLTVMVLDATLHNDWETSSDLISPSLIVFVAFSLILAVGLVYYRFKRVKAVKYWYIFLILFLLVIAALFSQFSIMRIISNKIPYNIYYVSDNYLSERKIASEHRESLASGSSCSTDSLTVVFVLGESLRADHLGLNGYERNTTPRLGALENLISLADVYTKHTYTNASVPFIMTRADTLTGQIAYSERSFVDIFKACDFQTSWLANQESAHTYVYFMHECDTLLFATINKSSYTYDKWLDEALLPDYAERLSTGASKKLLVVHTIGSHWWYNSHFTDEFAQFQPIAGSKIISSSTVEEKINSYDNTVLYTDNFLANMIEPLKSKNALFIYLSDHGESLGENNVWLHAADSPPAHHPAAFVWASDKYIAAYPDKYEALKRNRQKKHVTDFLFHSILDGSSISSPYLKKELSVFH